MSPPKVVDMFFPAIVWWADQHLDGSPSALHMRWADPDGQQHNYTEHFDAGAEWEEVSLCARIVIKAVEEEYTPFP